MGWETRAGRQYYYSKKRVNGTCISQYVGTGEVARLMAQLAEIDQQRRQFERDIRRAERAELTELDGQIDSFCAVVNQIVKVVLLVTGHHQHKREWRKRRMAKTQKGDANQYLIRLQTGKAKDDDIQKFKTAIKEVPTTLQLWNLVTMAQADTIESIAGVNQAFKIANLQLLKNIKNELGYNDASMLEKMIIDQIVLCHIRLYWVENLVNANLKEATRDRVIHWEKRLTLNQRRYFRAVETLARVRRLASRTPEILQVNIGTQQVNQVNAGN